MPSPGRFRPLWRSADCLRRGDGPSAASSHATRSRRSISPSSWGFLAFVRLAGLGGRVNVECDLTGICPNRYIHHMESSFAVIAEPNRRTILTLLASSERSVGELEQRLRLPQTSVSKHLRVLRNAGFVESRVEAQRRVYRLRPEPLIEVDAWLEQFRRFWNTHVDALERHLDRMDQSSKKGKKR